MGCADHAGYRRPQRFRASQAGADGGTPLLQRNQFQARGFDVLLRQRAFKLIEPAHPALGNRGLRIEIGQQRLLVAAFLALIEEFVTALEEEE